MGKIVCFTGHRTIPDWQYGRLQKQLSKELETQLENGADTFRTGGALGFDTMAALTVLQFRKRYPKLSLRLELLLPCPSQSDSWKASDARLYQQILENADSYRYLSPFYFSGVLQQRNRALVDGADVCIAYLTHNSGGTAYTASYALKQGLELINLQDRI